MDKRNPIQPTQVPRGYGGVAVLWRKNIDHMIRELPDGNECMQCKELKDSNSKPLLMVSAYLPTRGYKDSQDRFQEAVDQLYEIVQKFHISHSIIIGGDLNVDLSKADTRDQRFMYIESFIRECILQYTSDGNTYINPKREDCSEIDYFLYSESCNTEVSNKTTLRLMDSMISDHYPIHISISRQIQHRPVVNNSCTKDNQYRKIRWDKVDKDMYSSFVEVGLVQHSLSGENISNSVEDIESVALNVCTVLREAALKCVPAKRKNNPKHKLRVWSTEISMSLKCVREVNKNWNEAGRPNNYQHPLVIQRKQCKKELRRKIRTEIACKELKVKEDIVSTRRYDPKLFHSIIRKQRQKGNDIIIDLHVGDQCFTGEDKVINGFQKHFQDLAKCTPNPKFYTDFDELIQFEYTQIVELVKGNDVSEVTMDELRKAINAINKGKASDIYGLMIEHVVFGGEELAQSILSIINCIFKSGVVPDSLKNGLLTPIFKNKGSRLDAKYYRGITVLPVLCKLIDSIIKARIV